MSKKVNSLILVLIFLALTCTSAFAAPEFQTSAKRDQKIMTLKDQGYLHGYEDGSLKLEDKIKRSEFSTIVVYALEKQNLAKELQGKSEPFTDVKKNYWANGIISVIKDEKGLKNNINIIAGYPDGTFRPENKISNAEAIKMLVCLKKSDLTKEMVDNAKWPTSWIAWAKEEGIIGKDSNISEDLDYSAEALRGDVFTMFYNAFMDDDKKTFEYSKLRVKSVPVINVRDTERGYRESHSYNPPYKYKEGNSWTPLTPAEPFIPWTPLIPAEPYIPLTPLTPAESIEEYTLTAGTEVVDLTPAKENGKYDEGTEISFKVKEVAGKTVKVEKVVNGKPEELTVNNGQYSFKLEADTTIKVTYSQDVKAYELTIKDPLDGIKELIPANEGDKYRENTDVSFTINVAGKKAKVLKTSGGKTEELTKGADGKYRFKMTSDTTIEVTYEDVVQYTLRKDDFENAIRNLTNEDAEGSKYNAGRKISFTVEEKPGKVAVVRTVIGNLLDSAGEQKGIKATVIKKGKDGKYSFNIATDTTIRVSYKLVSSRVNKYDKVFVNTYEVNPERVMNLYKNTRQPNQPDATLGAYNYSFDGDNFVFMINPELKSKTIRGMQGTGLADGLIGVFTSNMGGKAPQQFLKKVTLKEVKTGETVELNESDLKSFASKWSGMRKMVEKGFPGMTTSSKLSDLAGKKFNITYEYHEGNTVYKKNRTLEFNYDYK